MLWRDRFQGAVVKFAGLDEAENSLAGHGRLRTWSGQGGDMKYFTAKDAKNQFGRLIDCARSEPVMVAKHGRPVAVLLSYEEYERVEALERAYWADKAGIAEQEGYLGPRESEALLNGRLALPD